MAKDKEEKQFLGLGDVFEALLGHDFKEKIPDFIATVAENGELSLNAKIHDNIFHFLRFFPEKNSPIGAECVVLEKSKGKNDFIACYPFFKGITNKLKIHQVLPDVNRLAGFVQLSKSDEAPMWMFDPFYSHSIGNELKTALENGEGDFSLSALAVEIEETPEKVLKIDKGDMYKYALKDFLEENPGKTKDDFPFVSVDVSHLSALFPSECIDGYEFSSDIVSVDKFGFMETTFYRLEIELLRDHEDGGIKVALYANEKILNGYTPKVGDNIRGYMQLCAY